MHHLSRMVRTKKTIRYLVHHMVETYMGQDMPEVSPVTVDMVT